jgi:hypothetical protein
LAVWSVASKEATMVVLKAA